VQRVFLTETNADRAILQYWQGKAMDAVSTEYNNEAEQLLSKAVRYPELRSGTKWLPKRSTVSLV